MKQLNVYSNLTDRLDLMAYRMAAELNGNSSTNSARMTSADLEAVQEAAKMLRSQSAELAYPVNLLHAIGIPCTSSDVDDEMRKHLEEVLNDLPDDETKALLLRFKEKKTLQEAGDAMDLSRERVRQLIKKAVRRLSLPEQKKAIVCGRTFLSELDKEKKAASEALASYVKAKTDYEKKTAWIREKTRRLDSAIEALSSDDDAYYESILDTKIVDLGLSVRATNCLVRSDIPTLRELVKKSDADLLRVRNLGRHSYEEITAKLEELGLRTKEPEAPAEKPGTVLDMPVRELGLSMRTTNSLLRADVNTLRDVTSLTEADLAKVRNLGRYGVNEVKAKLAEYHFALKGEPYEDTF
jgi:RNA polymerase sigma factor (sigma-70 family)